MPLSEFDMIARYFRNTGPHRSDTMLAIGDDAALIRIDEDRHLATTLLQWIQGIDYPSSEPAADTGQRLLRKAIELLEADGIKPAWMTLSLSFECLDEEWLHEFSRGLIELADRHDIQLIGGDSTRGPETLRLHLIGTSEINQMA